MNLDIPTGNKLRPINEILGTSYVPRTKDNSSNKRDSSSDLFRVSSIIDEFKSINSLFLGDDGVDGMIGTSNPSQFNLYSDIILNPSAISISEFQKMAYTMPVLSSGLTIIRLLILSKFGPYNHKNKKYKDFINKMIENMNRPMTEINEDILSFFYAGFFVGEKRYYSDGRYVYIIDVEPRPAQSIIFRVDAQGHLKDDGIIQYFFNNLWTGYGNFLSFNYNNGCGASRPNPYAARGDLDYPMRATWAQPIGTVVIPKEKCVHFAYKGIDGLTSPYGRSPLRPAYDSYVVRTEMTKITRNAANFKSSPIPVVIVSPNQAGRLLDDRDPFDIISDSLARLGEPGRGYLLIEGTKDSVTIDKIDSTADLDHIVGLNKYLDAQQLLSIFLAPELMGLADHGSNALGETQHDLLDQIVTSLADKMKQSVWIEQIVKPMLKLNFGEKEDFGSFDSNENVSSNVALNIEKGQFLASQGVKLKSSALLAMMDLDEDVMESENNDIEPNTKKVTPALRSRYAG